MLILKPEIMRKQKKGGKILLKGEIIKPCIMK
jgi:hypothetical protein